MKHLLKAIEFFGSQAELGEAVGVRQAAVAMWLNRNSVPPMRAIAIEQATGGKVRSVDLCPLVAEIARRVPKGRSRRHAG